MELLSTALNPCYRIFQISFGFSGAFGIRQVTSYLQDVKMVQYTCGKFQVVIAKSTLAARLNASVECFFLTVCSYC
jgi:hypothetical protein